MASRLQQYRIALRWWFQVYNSSICFSASQPCGGSHPRALQGIPAAIQAERHSHHDNRSAAWVVRWLFDFRMGMIEQDAAAREIDAAAVEESDCQRIGCPKVIAKKWLIVEVDNMAGARGGWRAAKRVAGLGCKKFCVGGPSAEDAIKPAPRGDYRANIGHKWAAIWPSREARPRENPGNLGIRASRKAPKTKKARGNISRIVSATRLQKDVCERAQGDLKKHLLPAAFRSSDPGWLSAEIERPQSFAAANIKPAADYGGRGPGLGVGEFAVTKFAIAVGTGGDEEQGAALVETQ